MFKFDHGIKPPMGGAPPTPPVLELLEEDAETVTCTLSPSLRPLTTSVLVESVIPVLIVRASIPVPFTTCTVELFMALLGIKRILSFCWTTMETVADRPSFKEMLCVVTVVAPPVGGAKVPVGRLVGRAPPEGRLVGGVEPVVPCAGFWAAALEFVVGVSEVNSTVTL